MSDYPEHDKMQALRPQIDAVTEFLEALENGKLHYGGQRLHLAIYMEDPATRPVCVGPSIASLLAEHFGIDQKRIEAEKRAMLESIRAANGG